MTMTMTADTDIHVPPLQFKGEILDFELGIEVDHRKRRRNRTTQSCLNCHTSKRKCDRKRPCQRCIQLGLTGLCVYEVDDPALRDDPNVDENTRLRNRIAELESLVRELRGKPHPRWAESSFCDGDANEKWHSRSSKRLQFSRPRRDGMENVGRQGENIVSHMPSAVKTEQAAELYRLSPDPAHMGHDAHAGVHVYRSQRTSSQYNGQYSPIDDSSVSYSPTTSIGSGGYGEQRQSGGSSSDYYQTFERHVTLDTSPAYSACPCLQNPAATHPLLSLVNHLQTSLDVLKRLPEHAGHQSCVIIKQITELDNNMRGAASPSSSVPAYETLSAHTDGELMSPISTSSQSSLGTSVHDWQSIAAQGSYGSYFPVSPGEQAVYHKTYHIN